MIQIKTSKFTFGFGDQNAIGGHVIQKSARGSVGRMNRANEAPGLWKKFSDVRRSHFLKIRTPMNCTKMRQIPEIIDFLRDYRQTVRLQNSKVSQKKFSNRQNFGFQTDFSTKISFSSRFSQQNFDFKTVFNWHQQKKNRIFHPFRIEK